MKNEIKILKKKEILEIKRKLEKKQSSCVIELEGEKFQTWEDYSEYISKVLDFPDGNPHSKDGYIDWMTDLTWLEKKSYVVIIYNYKNFLINNPQDREEIIDMFKSDILPFWEEEVIHVTSGGHAKSFDVYLVE